VADTAEIPFRARNDFGANSPDGTDKTFERLPELSNKRATGNVVIHKALVISILCN
jgi:hypothetical protein